MKINPLRLTLGCFGDITLFWWAQWQFGWSCFFQCVSNVFSGFYEWCFLNHSPKHWHRCSSAGLKLRAPYFPRCWMAWTSSQAIRYLSWTWSPTGSFHKKNSWWESSLHVNSACTMYNPSPTILGSVSGAKLALPPSSRRLHQQVPRPLRGTTWASSCRTMCSGWPNWKGTFVGNSWPSGGTTARGDKRRPRRSFSEASPTLKISTVNNCEPTTFGHFGHSQFVYHLINCHKPLCCTVSVLILYS